MRFIVIQLESQFITITTRGSATRGGNPFHRVAVVARAGYENLRKRYPLATTSPAEAKEFQPRTVTSGAIEAEAKHDEVL